MRILDKLFGPAEEINGHHRCPTYLYRWVVLQRPNWRVYLHHFVGDDWSLDLHDHPKRFVSIGLKGRYLESTPAGQKVYRAPWVRTFPAEHQHRITLIDGRACWTLVITLRIVRPWGFWHDGKFIYWREYVGSETADSRKSCD